MDMYSLILRSIWKTQITTELIEAQGKTETVAGSLSSFTTYFNQFNYIFRIPWNDVTSLSIKNTQVYSVWSVVIRCYLTTLRD